jgi:four helix bundle protein
MLQVFKSITIRRKIKYDTTGKKSSIICYLNIAEGCSRKSLAERKRFFEISRGSIIEIDAVLDLSEDLQRTFSMLTKMINLRQS